MTRVILGLVVLSASLACDRAPLTEQPEAARQPEARPRAASPWRVDNDRYRTHNAAQQLDVELSSIGARVTLAGTTDAFTIGLAAWGRSDAMTAAAPAVLAPGERGDRITMNRVDVEEWWQSLPIGVEQGWTVQEPPGQGALRLELVVAGARVSSVGERAVVLRTEGGARISYDGLAAWDADLAPLPSRFERTAGGLAIVVEVEGAEWPVRIDPWITRDGSWAPEMDLDGVLLGKSVDGAGDVNGDGYGDVIAGVPMYGSGGQSGEGRAHLYCGSASGLSSTPCWTFESDEQDAQLGFDVASAGDVNGDGYGDVIIGAPYFSSGQSDEGRVYLFLGAADGLPDTPDWSPESDQADAHLGISVGSAGDVNGDGYADVVVGADGYNDTLAGEGQVRVYLGSASGIDPAAPWTHASGQADAGLGWSVAAAGDVNGDGYSDVMAGAPRYDTSSHTDGGRAYIFYGSASGVQSASPWITERDQAAYGYAVSAAGDVNGDGYADVIVGTESRQRVWVFHGSASGASTSAAWYRWIVSYALGQALAPAGDVNDDGYGDVIIGNPGYTCGSSCSSAGQARIYLGSPTGLSDTYTGASSSTGGMLLGMSVASAGDVNGDGLADVVVGAPFYDNVETDEGTAVLFINRGDQLAHTPAWTQASPSQASAAAIAGDVNGDGFDDVILGYPHYSGGQTQEGRAVVYHGQADGLAASPAWDVEPDVTIHFGLSVDSAGDVNGDGYADVIVGAPLADGDFNNGGRAYVYHGSSAGLSPTAAWTADGSETEARFGRSVATAGDVNGDGYGDVIVGTGAARDAVVFLGSRVGLSLVPDWSVSSGRDLWVASAGDVNRDGFGDVIIGGSEQAQVFLGSASGLDTSAIWTVSGDQADSYFGEPVATAGDVDGDGFAEVLVGESYWNAHDTTNEGRAHLYYGSASGPSASADTIYEGFQTSSLYGRSLSSAGDVNGDGYSEFLVGAPYGDQGEINVGRVRLYRGPTADSPWYTIGASVNVQLGAVIAGAGDVNADGSADVILGTRWEHQLYLGGPSGPRAYRPHPQFTHTTQARPVAPWGYADTDRVTVSVHGNSPLGRTRIKLEVEIKPAGVPFDGAGTERTAAWTDTVDTNGVDLEETITGLSPDTPYHLRARVLYDPALDPPQLASRWLWGGISGQPSEVHLRTRPLNTPPVAVDDAVETPEDAPIDIEVVANDTDAEGDALTVTVFDDPGTQGGAVSLSGHPHGGTLTYVPAATWSGVDTFTYTMTDGFGGSDSATVTVTVTFVDDTPVPTDDVAATDEDVPVTTGDLLANDSDEEDDPLSVSAFDATSVEGGSVADAGGGTFTYTPPAHYSGSDSFTYTVTDGNSAAVGTVTITVTAVPDPPAAVDDSAETLQDTPVTTGDVLANDSDPEGDTLSISDFDATSAQGGTVEAAAGNTFLYTPPAGYSGTDTFTYTISDGNSGTDVGTVSITITPVSGPDAGGEDAAAEDAAADDAATEDAAVEDARPGLDVPQVEDAAVMDSASSADAGGGADANAAQDATTGADSGSGVDGALLIDGALSDGAGGLDAAPRDTAAGSDAWLVDSAGAGDSAASVDAAAGDDSGVDADAATGADGAEDEGGVASTDSGATGSDRAGASSPPTSHEAGCGCGGCECAATGAGPGAPYAATLLALALWTWRRRRARLT